MSAFVNSLDVVRAGIVFSPKADGAFLSPPGAPSATVFCDEAGCPADQCVACQSVGGPATAVDPREATYAPRSAAALKATGATPPGAGPEQRPPSCTRRPCCMSSSWAGETGPCELYERWAEQFELPDEPSGIGACQPSISATAERPESMMGCRSHHPARPASSIERALDLALAHDRGCFDTDERVF